MSEVQESVLESLLKQLVEAVAKPGKERGERLARMKRELHAEQTEVRRHRAEVQARCTHMRRDNTSVIAWAMQSDGIERGVCMHCNRLIVPTDKDYLALRPRSESHR